MEGSLGPGQQLRGNKFGIMCGTGRSTSKRTVHPYATDKELSFGYARDPKEFRKALELRNSFENTAQKLIKMRQGQTEEVNTDHLFSSFTNQMFQHPQHIKRDLQSHDAVDFSEAFAKRARMHNRESSVHISEVDKIVVDVVGKDFPEWIISKFVKLCRSKAKFGYVEWCHFKEIIPVAQKVVSSECDTEGRGLPDWLKKKAPINDATLNEDFPKSHYMASFNARRFINTPMDDNARKYATTKLMFKGTAKATEQLPGYCGHIPANTANIRKDLHSSGTRNRPQTCDLRLVSERLGSVPGYTGHIPLHTGLQEDRTTGMDPRTTSGHAYGPYFKNI